MFFRREGQKRSKIKRSQPSAAPTGQCVVGAFVDGVLGGFSAGEKKGLAKQDLS